MSGNGRMKIGEKKTPGEGILLSLLLAAAILVLFFSAWNLFSIFREYKAGVDEYESIKAMAVTEIIPEKEPQKARELSVKTQKWEAPIQVDFVKLKEINDDVAAWIYIEALPDISYPVVCGEDNEYYLHRTYDKKENSAGSIFIDYECDRQLKSCNTIIYGHNMKNGSMFGSLKKLANPEILKKNYNLWLITPDETYKYEIFSCYTTSVDSDTYTLIKGPGKELKEYAENMLEKSEVELGERDFGLTEHILTLSTCTGNDKTRFVVQAVQIQP